MVFKGCLGLFQHRTKANALALSFIIKLSCYSLVCGTKYVACLRKQQYLEQGLFYPVDTAVSK